MPGSNPTRLVVLRTILRRLRVLRRQDLTPHASSSLVSGYFGVLVPRRAVQDNRAISFDGMVKACAEAMGKDPAGDLKITQCCCSGRDLSRAVFLPRRFFVCVRSFPPFDGCLRASLTTR